MEICHLYISPGHNFVGHHDSEAGNYPTVEVESIECVAGRGIRGDRFFDYKEAYKGQVTFFASEVFAEMEASLHLEGSAAPDARRNVITHGVDLNTLIDREFEVQGVKFLGTEECRPCRWMDHVFKPGALEFLRGHGGLRARIISDGTLRSTTTVASA
ncbi:MAG: molybdenum cofactor biosysynthesis protein [Verrucomicrobiota bacterium]|nr:molybdenum cofactor biosysynthesis protein [Verrucomicrobiota bacterium]